MEINILDELLINDKPEINYPTTEAIRYESLKTARVNGKRAVIFPDGRMLGKAMDRRLGRSVWTIVGRRQVG